VSAVGIESILDELLEPSGRRSFGCPDPERRLAIRHGYLLAIEEVRRLVAEEETGGHAT
jgi:hypothetical protein